MHYFHTHPYRWHIRLSWIVLLCLVILVIPFSSFSTPKPHATWPTDGFILSIRYSPDGYLLASVEGTAHDPLHPQYVVHLRAIPTGQVVFTFDAQTDRIYTIAFSHQGHLFGIGDHAGRIRIWRVQDGTLLHTFSGHTEPVQQVVFSPDDTTLLSVSDDYTIREWDLVHGSSRSTIEWSHYYNCGIAQVRFVGTMAQFAVREGGTILLQTIPDQHPIQTIHGFEGSDCMDFEKLDIRLSEDGHFLASVDAWRGRENIIRLWNLQTGTMITELRGHRDLLSSVAFSPDNRLLASASGVPYYFLYTNGDQDIRIWRVADGQLLAIFPNAYSGAVNGLAFSPDNRTLAATGLNGNIQFWRIAP